MLSLSIDAARATDGLVTPAVGGAIIAAGYDRDFARLPCGRRRRSSPAAVPLARSRSRCAAGACCRTEPVMLDLNGVVKGRTVDDALALVGHGWVSAGGDIATHDTGRRRPPRRRHDRAPRRRARDLERRASAAGCADGGPQHHLIDPRTGRPADGPWRDVTVAAASCLAADVAAKAALLLGAAGLRGSTTAAWPAGSFAATAASS